MYFLGIDTSCYTSSIAVVDIFDNIIYDGRKLLEVATNSKGLRQSESVFQHSNNLPKLCAEAMDSVDSKQIACIGVSTKPRLVEGSYMPVFTSGHNLAKVISSCIKVPIIECSHQQGHIIAGAWSINKQYADNYLVYHISGGTTELLKVDDKNQAVEIIGGTEDLNAGQYIDRVGVSLGVKFPCGKEMDKLCSAFKANSIELPISVRNTVLSFSGPESHVQRLIQKETAVDEAFKAQIAVSVFLNISKAIEKTIFNASSHTKIKDVLMVGGVASNSIISKILQDSEKLKGLGIHINISKPQYSSDNAVGAAIYAKRAYQNFGGLNGQH
ncbi:MAG: hypothetical protein A2Y23_12535 [Clostridiales bacterium GWB2_37_7]|nr:MAG: hypothetical protein A2Y23_12535 [Clostridiales bacterium GWB2_37_7]